MKLKLFFKYATCFAFLFVASFLAINIIGNEQLESRVYEQKKSELYVAATNMSKSITDLYYSSKITSDVLLQQLSIIDKTLNIRIMVTNRDGYVIADTQPINPDNPEGERQISLFDCTPDFTSRTFAKDLVVKNLIPNPSLSVSLPSLQNQQLRGYIILLYSMDSLRATVSDFTFALNVGLISFWTVLLLVFLLLYRVSIYPVHQIMKAVRCYNDGDYSATIKVTGKDEYRVLSQNLMYMAGELSNMADYRKKFIANVSHDFRSPLTSIKGYAEAMLDGTIPVDKQEKYLNIILFESERLTKLTSSLLTLNNFENHGVVLDKTEFDMNVVVKQTAASFEVQCTKKHILLQLVFEEDEMKTEADVSKIQQVMTNLIDNAIKFSPNDSVIRISVMSRGDKLTISVKDSGVGIPRDSLPRVFERFYKTDASRGKDKKGTGLGLSITKEIITAHDEYINVISTEGAGSEFVFSLPYIKK